jgi:hypothetical protein
MLGGAVGLAIASSVVNSLVMPQLSDVLDGNMLDEITQQPEAILKLDPAVQLQVEEAFASAYQTTFKIITGLASAQFLSLAMMWKKEQLKLPKKS